MQRAFKAKDRPFDIIQALPIGRIGLPCNRVGLLDGRRPDAGESITKSLRLFLQSMLLEVLIKGGIDAVDQFFATFAAFRSTAGDTTSSNCGLS